MYVRAPSSPQRCGDTCCSSDQQCTREGNNEVCADSPCCDGPGVCCGDYNCCTAACVYCTGPDDCQTGYGIGVCVPPCPPNANYINEGGAIVCRCKPGYAGADCGSQLPFPWHYHHIHDPYCQTLIIEGDSLCLHDNPPHVLSGGTWVNGTCPPPYTKHVNETVICPGTSTLAAVFLFTQA